MGAWVVKVLSSRCQALTKQFPPGFGSATPSTSALGRAACLQMILPAYTGGCQNYGPFWVPSILGAALY